MVSNSKPRLPASWPAPLSPSRGLFLFVLSLFLHAAYLTRLAPAAGPAPAAAAPPPAPALARPVAAADPPADPAAARLPDVLVFRRSKKTGSSSMLEALMRATEPLGYVPLYHGPLMMLDVVRAEGLRPAPRRLLVAQHNRVTRDTAAPRPVLIADTVLDGYRQVTSYCRYFEHVPDCGPEMDACLERPNTRQLNFYRWAGRAQEDAATFIDLPLSSGHPALSTTVFRHLLPAAVLDVQKINSVGSACPESPRLRDVYRRHYAELDAQVERLRRRMLAMAGYPVVADRKYNISTDELLDRAEEMESVKYNFGEQKVSRAMSDGIRKLWREKNEWMRSPGGEIVLKDK